MTDPGVPADGQAGLTLDSERFDALVRLSENPPPGPKLNALLRRVPAWSRQAAFDGGPAS